MTFETEIGEIVSVAPLLVPFKLPTIEAATDVEVAIVETVKVTDEEPDGTITFEGTLAETELLEIATVTPDWGALPFRVTVPVAKFPPTTEAGLSESEDTRNGFRVKTAV